MNYNLCRKRVAQLEVGISPHALLRDNSSGGQARVNLCLSFATAVKMKISSPLPISSRHPFLRTCLTLGSLLVLVLVTGLACDAQKPNGGIPQPVVGPFTAKDCEIPFMPAPVTAEEEIYPTRIYCVFHSGGSVLGVMYFSLSYSEKVDDALKEYSVWHDGIVNNYSDYTAITDTLEELFVMKVTTDMVSPNPTEDIDAVQIYEQHFVIRVDGHLDNTDQSAATGMVVNLFDYGTGTADEHYPAYH